ncbi:MAG: hypothetical protein SFV17_05375 [Candidatus Obscuribacter sp.]|nr:hypothetical protein [Candidatus Obscuribacter sp.]
MKLKYLIEASAALAEADEIEAHQAIETIIDRELNPQASAEKSCLQPPFYTTTPAKKSRRNNHEK